MAEFLPLQSIVGGLFIGAACGAYMLFSGRVAGNSGALKALILGPREPTKLAFLCGLLGGGVLMGSCLPSAFEAMPWTPVKLAVAGTSVGLGTALANGCTSGHGLCGLSRLSLRSLVAVPTFMVVAGATATWSSGGAVGAPLPICTTPDAVLALAAKLASALLAALVPALFMGGRENERLRELYVGVWAGVCFAVGLAIGGMVRPSVVAGALSPARFDGTLWALFMTALATTFVPYRLAQASGVASAKSPPTAKVDSALVVGSALFGLGWGLAGVCPGPHIVCLGASPAAAAPLLMLAFVTLGILLSEPVRAALGSPTF